MSDKKTNPVSNYISGSVSELNKVTWPTGKKSVQVAVIVLSFCLATAIFIGIFDWVFNVGYNQLINISEMR